MLQQKAYADESRPNEEKKKEEGKIREGKEGSGEGMVLKCL